MCDPKYSNYERKNSKNLGTRVLLFFFIYIKTYIYDFIFHWWMCFTTLPCKVIVQGNKNAIFRFSASVAKTNNLYVALI